MKPVFLAAGGPENIITWLGYHYFIADGACDGETFQKTLGNLLGGPMVNAERVEGPTVLVEHTRISATAKMVNPLAFGVATVHCCSCSATFMAL